jgi:peptide/nickel transport system ATP-binding protein
MPYWRKGGHPVPSSHVARIDGLRVEVGGRAIVDGIDVEMRAGRCTALVGASGSGKTTTGLALLGEYPDGSTVSGTVDVPAGRAGYIPQHPATALNPARRVGALLADIARLGGGTRAERAERVREALRLAQLPDPDEVLGRFPHQLSGGQQQRAVLAQAFLLGARVVVADEPTTGQDALTKQRVVAQLTEVKRQGIAVVLLSHDLDVVQELADEVVVMRAGRAVESGPTAEIFAAPEHEWTRELLAGRTRGLPPEPAPLPGPADPALLPAPAPAADVSPAAWREGTREPQSGARPLAATGDAASQPASGAGVFAVQQTEKTRELPSRVEPLVDPGDAASQPVPAAGVEPPGGEPGSAGSRLVPAGPGLAWHRPGSASLSRSRRASGMDEPGPAERDGRRPRLAVDGLSAWHGLRRPATTILHEASLTVGAGECLAVVGRSGSGKTTLARCLAGLHRRWSGGAALDGSPLPRSLRDRSTAQLAAVQYVFQDAHAAFDAYRPVLDQIARTAVRLRGLGRDAARAEALAVLADVGLAAETAARRPGGLSGGELRRAALARALLAEPCVLICDEITSGLDTVAQRGICDLLHRLKGQGGGTSLVLITHDLAVAAELGDRIAVFDGGRVVEQGPAARILAAPAHSFTAGLLGATRAAGYSPGGRGGVPCGAGTAAVGTGRVAAAAVGTASWGPGPGAAAAAGGSVRADPRP